MSRRLFLERLAALTGFSLAAPAARAVGAPTVEAELLRELPPALSQTLLQELPQGPRRELPQELAQPLPQQLPRELPRKLRWELQRSPVAGFQFHCGDAVWRQLTPGATLDLVREAGNAYDARAVRVDWQGRKLGYVPRIDNAAVSQLLDRGQTLEARIVTLRESPNPWDRIEFAVFLLDHGAQPA